MHREEVWIDTAMFPKVFDRAMVKKKLFRWSRIIRYSLNHIWNHVLVPVGMPEDEFSKEFKSKPE
ncbi:hypothetical protein [Costertonia aggregata]|uniref:Uncharacterized protein n=1 Tax=Costertonia aggregata TaxID=343403 RepID=A0A7H9ATG0_9FLAO|nr:hypothetical protein [Costertonia aggregata]QLG46632.1 hypothetical protein HYG79_15160 [Costertonia aggregata]